MFPSLFSVYPHLKSGMIQALAVAGSTRSAALPDLPTLAEAGVKGVDVPQWYAIFAPAKAAPSVVVTLNKALNQALADPAVAQKIAEQGAEVRQSTPAELGRSWRARHCVGSSCWASASWLRADGRYTCISISRSASKFFKFGNTRPRSSRPAPNHAPSEAPSWSTANVGSKRPLSTKPGPSRAISGCVP